MSGIGVILNLDGAPVARDDLERMANALHMHGPDGRAVVARGPVGLVHTLHRFTPEDAFERQPVTGGGGRYLMVMDGRVDNRDELAAALDLPAQRLVRMPDSALFMRAFEAWGEGCFNRIVGEFAVAIWDHSEQRLLCARDHFGKRPLHYHHAGSRLAVASMPKGLFALPWVPRELNEQKLADYLILNFCDGASTYFKDVRRLLGAHILTVGRGEGGVSTRRYWNLMDAPDVRLPSDDDYVKALREKLDVAVRAHLRSATPVGAFMSGGLDSSTVAVTAAGILAERGQRLPTFTAVPEEGFDGGEGPGWYADEAPFVEAIARKVPSIEVNLVRAEGRGLYDRMEQVFLAYEAPPRNAKNLFWGQAIVEEARARGLRVMLTGGAGNSTISHDGGPLLPQLFLKGRWGSLWRELRAAPAHRFPILGPFVKSVMYPLLPPPLWRVALHRHNGRGPAWRRHSAIHPDFAATHNVTARAATLGFDPTYQAYVNGRRQRSDMLTSDTAHEAGDLAAGYRAIFGVEERDPTGDRRVAELCLGMPEDQFLRHGRTRWLVRRAMVDRLPTEVLDNVKDGRQAADWFPRLTRERERLAADLQRFNGNLLLRRAINLPRLARTVENWPVRRPGEAADALLLELGLARAIAVGRFTLWVAGRNN